MGVLEGGCESDHTRHVPAKAGEVVIGQAVSEWARVGMLSGFRSVIAPAITYARKSGPFYLSEDTLLCLRPSQSAVMPSVVNVPEPPRLTPQSWLSSKLPGTNHERFQK